MSTLEKIAEHYNELKLKFDEARQKVVINMTKAGDAINFPKIGDSIMIHYIAYLPDGTPFDNSFQRGLPLYFIFGAGQVLLGLECVLPLMSKGTRAKLTIPSDLAYGANGYPPSVPPNTTLMFEIELISFSSDGTVYREYKERSKRDLEFLENIT